jgi:hypothetical protein
MHRENAWPGKMIVTLMWLKILSLVKTCNTGRAETAAQTVILEGIVTNSEIETRCSNGDSNSG